MLGKDTYIKLDLAKGVQSPREWGAAIESYNGKTMTVQIRPAPKAVVARWRLIAVTSAKASSV